MTVNKNIYLVSSEDGKVFGVGMTERSFKERHKDADWSKFRNYLKARGEELVLVAWWENKPIPDHDIDFYLKKIPGILKFAEWFSHNTTIDIIKDIIAEDRRAGEFIRHLRAFFKRGDLDKKALDINGVVNDAVSLFKSEAVFRHVFIDSALDMKLPAALANEIHVQQVILNLVLNAAESMLEVNDSPKRIVISTMRENAACLKIGVRDSGIGVDPANLAAIFNPYFTTKKDGMGMGLAICRSIVEAHGGKIWAENNPDRGTTFYFSLPYYHIPRSAASPEESRKPAGA